MPHEWLERGVPVVYRNVKQDKAQLDAMLKFSKGRWEIPVIVENGKVSIGFGGT